MRIGTGQIGKCIRFTLDLAEDSGDAPRSVVGKFPSDDPTSRKTGVELRNYIKEVSFYRDLQARLSIRSPRCYYAAIVGEGPEFSLILEDIAAAVPGDQLAGCSTRVARAAVLELVGLHAPSWDNASFRGIDWLGGPSADFVAMVRRLYETMLLGFLARYGSHLRRDEIEIIEQVASSAGPPFEYPAAPLALVHVDYRLDNMLIDDRIDPPRVTVVDWQSITLGNPLTDVAYFLGAGLLPDERRPCEQGIVGEYHDALTSAGITDYPYEHCWDDYRRGVFAGFAVTVIASMLVQETERGNQMFIAMARRHARHALDLGSEEFLR